MSHFAGARWDQNAQGGKAALPPRFLLRKNARTALSRRPIVVAKFACLRFRLTAKTTTAPLLLLSPPDPLPLGSGGEPLYWGPEVYSMAGRAKQSGPLRGPAGKLAALKSVLRQSGSDNGHGIAPTKCPILRGPVGIKMLRAAKPPFRRDFCSAKMLVRRFRAAPSSSQSSLVSVSASRRKLRPLPCSSSPHPTRCRWARAGNPCIGAPRSIPWQGEQNKAGP